MPTVTFNIPENSTDPSLAVGSTTEMTAIETTTSVAVAVVVLGQSAVPENERTDETVPAEIGAAVADSTGMPTVVVVLK